MVGIQITDGNPNNGHLIEGPNNIEQLLGRQSGFQDMA